MEPLPVFKALGDDTRFAIYQELAQSPAPCSASELAERLSLHPNTVRPHLDRMREAGLVEVEPIHRGTVGRPQLRYSLAPGAPGLGFDPPAHTLLAGLLAALAEELGGDGLDASNLGRRWGTDATGRRQSGRGCLAALVAELDRLGLRSRGVGARGRGRHCTSGWWSSGAGRLPPLPLPGAGRGLSGARLQPPPWDRRGCGGR